MISSQRVELSDYNIKFKFIKGVKNTLSDTFSRLMILELMELNIPEKQVMNMDMLCLKSSLCRCMKYRWYYNENGK